MPTNKASISRGSLLTENEGQLTAHAQVDVERSVSLVLLLIPRVGNHDTARNHLRHLVVTKIIDR